MSLCSHFYVANDIKRQYAFLMSCLCRYNNNDNSNNNWFLIERYLQWQINSALQLMSLNIKISTNSNVMIYYSSISYVASVNYCRLDIAAMTCILIELPFFVQNKSCSSLVSMKINAQVKHDFIRMTSHVDSLIRSKTQLRNGPISDLFFYSL